MDFQAIQNEVGAQLRFDVSVAANLTLVKRWINRAQQYITAKHDWTWLQAREIVQTAVDKTQDSPASSSIAITSGLASVVGNGTNFATTDVGRYIQFPDENDDWYRITARASATGCTIESPFTGDTLTAGDYTNRTFWYSLSSSVDKVLWVRQARSPRKLVAMDPITIDRWAPYYSETSNQPRAYSMFGLDSSYYNVIQFYPWPSEVMNMEVFYIKSAADLSGNTDTGPMPQKLRDMLLVEGGIAFGREYLNDSRYTFSWNRFTQILDDAILADGMNAGVLRTLESIDQNVEDVGSIRYPSDFPIINQ